jgi:2-(1,2-epoxy-1,2-dihydrophenyl)acetyl-CoA isomerase
MAYENIIVEREGAIGRLTLNRPEKLNAFIGTMREELLQAFKELGNDESIRVIVLTGAGRGFCSGADVGYLQKLLEKKDSSSFELLLDAGRSVVRRMRKLSIPVIAAVNGPAAGGGLNLALGCDIRIASDAASFGQSFSKIGLVPDWGGIHFLPRLVGEAKALELMLTGEMIGAEEALRIGLVNRVVPAAELQAATQQLAETLAARPPRSVRYIKRGIYNSLSQSLSKNLEFEVESQLRCFKTKDVREGVGAFNEKRTPNFTGE